MNVNKFLINRTINLLTDDRHCSALRKTELAHFMNYKPCTDPATAPRSK